VYLTTTSQHLLFTVYILGLSGLIVCIYLVWEYTSVVNSVNKSVKIAFYTAPPFFLRQHRDHIGARLYVFLSLIERLELECVCILS